MKILKKSFILNIFIFGLTLVLTSCSFLSNNNLDVVYNNWKISIPKNCKEIFYIDSGQSFLGDGERYNIIEYTDTTLIDKRFDWKNQKNEEIEKSIKSTCEGLEIKDEYKINFENPYKYFYKSKEDNSEIYLIFFPENKRLFIIENIM